MTGDRLRHGGSTTTPPADTAVGMKPMQGSMRKASTERKTGGTARDGEDQQEE